MRPPPLWEELNKSFRLGRDGVREIVVGPTRSKAAAADVWPLDYAYLRCEGGLKGAHCMTLNCPNKCYAQSNFKGTSES